MLFDYFLIAAWMFGSLFIWPWMRFFLEHTDKRLRWVRIVFLGHLILIGLSFVCVIYASDAYQRDWGYSLVYPYFIGALSPVLSIGLILLGGITQGRAEKQSGILVALHDAID